MDRPNAPAFDSSELKELKQKLVDGCHILDREGITDGYGHVSVRIPGTEAFLTIAGVSPGCATSGSARSCWTSTATISAAKNRRPTSGRFTPVLCALAQR